jgi:putative membrane protein insertion efficiency factor
MAIDESRSDVRTVESQTTKPYGCGLEGDLRRILVHAERVVNRVLILGIWLYRNTLSSVFPPSCRFHPSCSEYATEALKRFGPIKGGWLAAKRLLRCHPFHPGGYDPLP